jgi:hypothetical protein
MVAHACDPSYVRDRVGESWFQAGPREKSETLSEN